MIETEEVSDLIKNKPKHVELILTGCYALSKLLMPPT